MGVRVGISIDGVGVSGENVAVIGGAKTTGVGELGNAVGVEKGVGGGLYGNGSTIQPEHPDRRIALTAHK